MANVFKSRHKSDVSVAQTDTLVTASNGETDNFNRFAISE